MYDPAKRHGGAMWGQLLELRHPSDIAQYRLTRAASDGFWDKGDAPEPKIHRIHAYPAKFPAFLTTKALHYAAGQGVEVKRVGDVFCGCGTVALEARRAGVDFWGCDINPVATLIARAKSAVYEPSKLRFYAAKICAAYDSAEPSLALSETAQGRLHHWYGAEQFQKLSRLLNAVRATVSARHRYSTPFLCAFSAILKSTSQWRRRAVKPHFDPHKQPDDPLVAFRVQCEFMARAWEEGPSLKRTRHEIHTANLLTVEPPEGGLDMIVTSPPYVTSYEYADLHQLSSLWLGFADDYRSLRDGSIGSTQHTLNFKREFKSLNAVGTQVVFTLYDKDRAAAQAIAKYYLDMQYVAARCLSFLRPGGIGVFVIGNTEYKGVHVDNGSHLAVALLEAGFGRVKVTKRRIINKAHTPYRRQDGKFSQRETNKQTYAEEFILLAHR